ncbi:MAG: glycoside hydrolase family 1 protein [Candidatus Paceibacterota bacterium]
MKTFPENFYWGAATASYQVEGGIENVDWAKAAREGKVPVCGLACDHYNRFEEDFDIAKELGHNAHRLSVEWARIEPEEGKFNEEEIEHYRQVLRALRERGMKPFITLWHFTSPQWFVDKGGFEHKDAPQIFARYCVYVVEKLGDLCDSYSTINEALPYTSNGWRRGTWPPFKKWPGIDRVGVPTYSNFHKMKEEISMGNIFKYFYVLRNLAKAHNQAYDAIKSVRTAANVGIVHHVLLFHSNDNLFNKLRAKFMNWHWTHQHLSRVYKKCDSIGLNYYLHRKFGETSVYQKTDMDWDVYPEGIYAALKMLWRYKKPIYVTEAGVADHDDDIRADYIKKQVEAVGRALSEGVDVRGHMYWSLLDNYEWALGFEKRFGLVEIDYSTLERKIRPSAYTYKKIIERNGVV